MDNFPPHDCCTRCNGANCMPRNANAIILAASTFKNRRNRETKCKSKELGKLMIAVGFINLNFQQEFFFFSSQNTKVGSLISIFY